MLARYVQLRLEPAMSAVDDLNQLLRQFLMDFLDWYDPEASHRDIGLEGPVDDFLKSPR